MSIINDLEFYKNVFNNLPVSIFVTDIKTGFIIDANHQAYLLLGLDNSSVLNHHYSDLFPRNKKITKELFENHIKLLQNNEEIWPIEQLVYDKNNNCIPVEITHTLAKIENKIVLISVLKDISEVRKHQNILSYYDKALEKSSAFLSVVDKNYVYQSVNESYAKLFNKTKEEIVGTTIIDLLGEEYFYKNVKEKFASTLNGTHESYESEFKSPTTNKTVYFSVNYEPYYSIENEIMGVVISVHEITKYKEAVNINLKNEKILIQQSKMAAMGEMLENIAHQWRQPLSLISTCASGLVLQKELDNIDDKTLDESLKKIVETTFYLSDTIDDFKNFFKRDKERTTFCINDVTKKTVELMHMNFSNIEIIRNMKDKISLTSYPNEFMQVLLNIINNSKDALLHDDISTDKKNIIDISIYKEEEKAVIEIKDNAGGIPLDIIDKIFEPYFTTKHQAQGTGIGLFMTREIITKHMNGEIEVENTKFTHAGIDYTGALFRIIL